MPDLQQRGLCSDAAAHELVLAARDLAAELLGDLGDRWLHTQGVADRAGFTTATVPETDRPALIAAAWLHDIGYAAPLRRSTFHPLDGACYLQERSWPDQLVGLVAHHSGARFVADVLNGTPSIVVGVFAWAWIVARQKHFSSLAGSVALAVEMLYAGVRGNV